MGNLLRRDVFTRLQGTGSMLMRRLGPGPAWLAAACCAALACYAVPRGLDAWDLSGIDDDPVAIADSALVARFDTEAAREGIENALAADDADLAASFVALAKERHLPVDPVLAGKVESAVRESSSGRRAAESFALGLVTGEPKDGAGLAGTLAGDLFVLGDIRDAAREGARLATGQPADELLLGLSCVGIAITGVTYATAGLGAPVRAGLSLMKAARKAGRFGAGLAAGTRRLLRGVVDFAQVRRAASSLGAAEPAAAMRAARGAVRLERAGKLVDLARDIGTVQAKAGTRAALDGLHLAETPGDVSRVARLAEKEGSRTRAILKFLGRGAIWLGFTSIDLALWIASAAFSLFGLVWSLKRGVERMTERHLYRRKQRRLRRYLAMTAR